MTHTPRCRNVMVVEDDEDIRNAIVEALTLENFRVTAAANGKEALDLLQNAPQTWRPCFILLDLMMPVMNGWEFLMIQKNDPALSDIPVVVCSAVAERAKYPWIVDYLKKPLDLNDLIAVVNRHCDPMLKTNHLDE